MNSPNGKLSQPVLRNLDHIRYLLRHERTELVETGVRTGGRDVPNTELSEEQRLYRDLGKVGYILDTFLKDIRAGR